MCICEHHLPVPQNLQTHPIEKEKKARSQSERQMKLTGSARANRKKFPLSSERGLYMQFKKEAPRG